MSWFNMYVIWQLFFGLRNFREGHSRLHKRRNSFRRKTNIWFSFKVFFPRDKQADTSRRRYPSGGLSNSSDIDGLWRVLSLLCPPPGSPYRLGQWRVTLPSSVWMTPVTPPVWYSEVDLSLLSTSGQLLSSGHGASAMQCSSRQIKFICRETILRVGLKVW